MADLNKRKEKYFRLNTQLQYLDTSAITSLLSNGEEKKGWGKTQVVEVDSTEVFIKRLALTHLQVKDIYCSKNLHELPTYYQYGVGSAGFGPPRELLSHIKTSNWVLSGGTSAFPLLYHHRVIPRLSEPVEIDQKELDDYVEYWGSSENLRSYLLDRSEAEYELVLFLEHLPNPLNDWLIANPDKTPWVFEEVFKTIAFLSKNDVIHCDINLWNMLTDGEEVFLTDFGLTLDKQFDLSKEEQKFFETNSFADYGDLIANIQIPFQEMFKALAEETQTSIFEKLGIADSKELSHHEWRTALSKNLEVVCKNDAIEVSDEYYNLLLKYRKILRLMTDFFTELRQNKKKDTALPNERLKELLVEVGILFRE